MNLLNHVFLFILIFLGIFDIKAQQQSLSFSYDSEGNMTQRKIQVVMGARFGNFNNSPKDSVISAERNLQVFPNPTSQYLNIDGTLPKNALEAKISFISATGQYLKEDLFISGQKKAVYVGDLNPGIYILELKISEKERSSFKIIISN